MKLITTLLFSMSFSWTFSQTFTSSHLPIVVVNTVIAPSMKQTSLTNQKLRQPWESSTILREQIQSEIPMNMTDPLVLKPEGILLRISIRKRIHWNCARPQGLDSSSAILGMGKEEDWILHAMVIDKSLLRIPFTFNLARTAGHYASDWRYVELVVDGDYRGVYIMNEKIKRDDDRVDIAQLNAIDISGDQVTGGYILRIDWLDAPQGFASNYNSQSGDPMYFQWYYPKANAIQPAQAAYIQSYMQTFEDAVFGPNFQNSTGSHWSHYADLTSFADFLLINEFAKNADGYKLSSYIHKDKQSKGGKFKAGLFGILIKHMVCRKSVLVMTRQGGTYLQNQPQCEDLESMPMWWQTMMTDPIFQNHVKCRWETLRQGPLHQDSVYAWIDQHTQYLGAAIDRNFEKWDDFLGQEIWIEPLPVPADYPGEIQQMKTWIASRLTWMDANMPGACSQDVATIEPFLPPILKSSQTLQVINFS